MHRLLTVVASPVAEHGLKGMQALVVVARGISCSEACGIFPDQGLNPCPLHWHVDSQPLDHQESLPAVLNAGSGNVTRLDGPHP